MKCLLLAKMKEMPQAPRGTQKAESLQWPEEQKCHWDKYTTFEWDNSAGDTDICSFYCVQKKATATSPTF